MDSPEGQTHPEFGAKMARRIVYWSLRLRGRSSFDAGTISDEIFDLCLFHSTHYAQMHGHPVSMLYLPDKVSVLFDPPGFYLLRGKLSGEVYEYTWRENDTVGVEMTPEQWLERYRAYIARKAKKHFQDQEHLESRRLASLMFKALGARGLPPCECEICTEKK